MAPQTQPQKPPVQTSKTPPRVKTPQEVTNDRIAALELKQARQENLTRATLKLSKFQDDVMAQAESWLIAARRVGSAYRIAFDTFNTALGEQAKRDAMWQQIAFSLLTMMASGALSWVSSMMQWTPQARLDYARWRVRRAEELKRFVLIPGLKRNVQQLAALARPQRMMLIEAAEDMAQAGVGAAFGNIAPLLFNSKQDISQDPQSFQNDKENEVSQDKIAVFQYFAKIKDDWAKSSLDQWDNYEEKVQTAAHDLWKSEAVQLAGKDDLPSDEMMQMELERGLWAKWMPSLESYDYNKPDYVLDHSKYKSIGSAIEERFKLLGILRMADVSIHWYQKAKSEDLKLIAWANSYKVQDYATLKKGEGMWPTWSKKS
jgi:hypothetical protein